MNSINQLPLNRLTKILEMLRKIENTLANIGFFCVPIIAMLTALLAWCLPSGIGV